MADESPRRELLGDPVERLRAVTESMRGAAWSQVKEVRIRALDLEIRAGKDFLQFCSERGVAVVSF